MLKLPDLVVWRSALLTLGVAVGVLVAIGVMVGVLVAVGVVVEVPVGVGVLPPPLAHPPNLKLPIRVRQLNWVMPEG